MEKDFNKKINEIIAGLGNTNYDSIIGQIKIIIYFQELLMRKLVTKEELFNLFFKTPIEYNGREVLYEVFGEIGQNLNHSHRCNPIWDDFGESYLMYLFKNLKNMQKEGVLLNECNS